ncbi:MAG TPA: L,D-transpeptidase [Thermomicrobiales bacterium]|nr:L,D-transpeptidase [Thermomicrobiales bacterium]
MTQGRSFRFSAAIRNRATLIIALLALFAALFTPTAATAQDAASGQVVYFEETGQVMSGAFLDAWFLHGGPDRTGFPVTAPIKIGDNWVQWFEYARFEVTAENYGDAEADAVRAEPVGRSYAERFGYAHRHPAFQPVEGAGEGARFFEETGHSVANAFLDTYESGNNAEYLGLPISQEFSINGTTYQFFEYGALSWTSETGTQYVPVGTLEAMLHGTLGNRVERPEGADVYAPGFFALRGQYPGERWIEVNLSTYTLTAWAGNTPVMSSLVVIGAPLTPTIPGEFRIYWKLPSQTMEGVSPYSGPYRQEDVPHVMYYVDDWAIHGSYWRSSFGYAASNGCVNLPLAEAAWLYDWAPIGTRVVVHY